MIYLIDDSIIIRDIIEEDAAALFSWRIDKEINKFDLRPTPDNITELLEQCNDFYTIFSDQIMPVNHVDKKYFYFMITDTVGMPVGCVNFFNINKEKKQGELGVTIGERSYRKRGIAFKAVEFVVSYIFKNMDIKRIFIETGETNLPSLKLFSKLGFKKCGEYIEENDFRFIVMEIRKM